MPLSLLQRSYKDASLDMRLKFSLISREASASLQCRRILGGRKLVVCVRIAVTAIFDFMTEEE